MARVRDFLKRLIKGVKSNMSGIFSAASIAFLTAGIATLLWTVGSQAGTFYESLWKFFMILGGFLLVVSVELLRREQKKRDEERNTLLSEIKGLRNDLRKWLAGEKE